MALDQFHPLSSAEIAKAPQGRGIYLLFQIQIPIHAGGAENLRKELVRARRQFPGASHFSMETMNVDAQSVGRRVCEVKKRLKLVRTGAFVGSRG
jgi:hypothetical protein